VVSEWDDAGSNEVRSLLVWEKYVTKCSIMEN